MTPIAIQVEHLSKRYRIGQARARYGSLRDSLAAAARLPLRRPAAAPANEANFIWALNDVSFEIPQGEAVGIIGRNGAGKSTLLKILARITRPTEGRVRLHGRVGSLLEVGTGFHPELTGRENIQLNGAVLGMKRAEINSKFDEIVDFAEIAQFLDTPVKHYSSGMYMRLAFAVAAHLEPEILLVDEVLAVGDAEFQKKCLGKMGEVAGEGRTVLLVSHNLGAVQQLCRTTVLLDNGRAILHDSATLVVRRYIEQYRKLSGVWRRSEDQPHPDLIYLQEIAIGDPAGQADAHIDAAQPVTIRISLKALKEMRGVQLHLRVTNQEGIPVFTTANTDAANGAADGALSIQPGAHAYQLVIPGGFLMPGSYSIIAAALVPNVKIYDQVDQGIHFTIEDTGSHATRYDDRRLGVVTPVITWHEIDV